MSFLFSLRKWLAEGRVIKARHRLIVEEQKWQSYNCGRHLYNHLTGGRLARAEAAYKSAREDVDRLVQGEANVRHLERMHRGR